MCVRCAKAEVGTFYPETTHVIERTGQRSTLIEVDTAKYTRRLVMQGRCGRCGMKRGSVVRRLRNRSIGGKRGRNSGKVKSHGKAS